MSFKKMKTNFTFTDISLFASMEKNRAIKRMEQINATVDWSRIESLLMRKYPVGKSFEGNDAYPPLIPYEVPSSSAMVQDRFRPGTGNSNQRQDFFQNVPGTFP